MCNNGNVKPCTTRSVDCTVRRNRINKLDLIGDFSLVGMPIKGKVIAYKSGHRINTEVAKVIRKLVLEN